MTDQTHGVHRRILTLLALVTLALLSIFLFVEHSWRQRADLLLRERVAESRRTTERILELRASGARAFADETARWQELVRFVHLVDAHWGDVNLAQKLATVGADVAWVLNDQFELIYIANPSYARDLAPLPVPVGTLANALTTEPVRHFYAPNPRGIIEVWTSPIRPEMEPGRKATIHGHYVVGRVWTDVRMRELAHDADAEVRISPDRGPYPEPSMSRRGRASITVPLPGIDGSPIAGVRFRFVYPFVARDYQTMRLSLAALLGVVLCVVLGVGWSLFRWAGRARASAEALPEPPLLRLSGPLLDAIERLAQAIKDHIASRKERGEDADAVAGTARSLAGASHEPMHLSFGVIGLDEIVANAAEEFVLDSDKSQLRVNIRAEGPLGTVRADGAKITQVLSNLLFNAKRASRPGGAVTIRLATSEGLARVAVEDTGADIPGCTFDKLVQGATDIGLALCREIVEGHEGQIWAENREEGGTRIAFQIPVDGPSAARAEQDDLGPIAQTA